MTQNPKENAIETCASIWQHANKKEKELIQSILRTMLKPAKVVQWKPTGKTNEYELKLDHEVLGSHPEIPIGQIVLKPKVTLAFLEELIPGTQKYRKVIAFPDQGICHRMGIGWLSKETPLQRIVIEEDQKDNVWCTVEGFGQSIVKPADVTLSFWNKMKWS
jgi:hypothetical protein